MSDHSKNPLDFVTSQELVAELKSRFDTFVFLAEKSLDIKSDEIWVEWSGSVHTCIGLCQRHAHKLIVSSINQEPEDDE